MHHSMFRRLLLIFLAVASVEFLTNAQAFGQISRVGTTQSVISGATRGTDTTHDPVNHVFLVVSAYGAVSGVFVNEAGNAVTAPFPISSNPNVFATYPRAVYSHDSGSFLVVWHQNDGPIVNNAAMNQVHGRMVTFGASPSVGPDILLGFSSPYGSWWEAAPAGAYSAASHVFLVTWQTYISNTIQGVLLNPTGQVISGVMTISTGGGRDPGVAWNSSTDEFGVSYAGWDDTSPTVSLARVRASDGAVMRRTLVERSSGSFITDVTFNSGSSTFVMVWAAPGPRTAELTSGGDVITKGLTASTVGTYDGLALAYNPASGTVLMVGQYTAEIGGVELDGHGAKIGVEQPVTLTGTTLGSFYPRVSGGIGPKLWSVSYSLGFGAAAHQVIGTASTGGGNQGDTDGDAVPDTVDQCPNQYAQTANGCPAPPTDTDGDGVADSVDQCPNQFAQTASGCPAPPDSDHDGLTDNVDACPTAFAQTANGCPLPGPASGDFDGDGTSDIVFGNAQGQAYRWHTSVVTTNNVSTLTFVPNQSGYLWLDSSTPGWTVVGTADLTGDGMSDLLWQNQITGDVRLFRMAFLSKIGEQTAGLNVSDKNWRIVGTGDFNGDGKPDILWRHQVNGSVAMWFMNPSNAQAVMQSAALVKSNGQPVGPGAEWQIVGSSDFDGDGHRDIAWQNTNDGTIRLWGLNADTLLTQMDIGTVAPSWRVRSIANFAGDSLADALFQNVNTGQLYLWIRSGTNFVPFGFLSPSSVNPVWTVNGPR